MQAAHFGFRIKEVPARCRYFEDASSVGFKTGVVYGLKTLWAGVRLVLHRTASGGRGSTSADPAAPANRPLPPLSGRVAAVGRLLLLRVVRPLNATSRSIAHCSELAGVSWPTRRSRSISSARRASAARTSSCHG